MYAVTGATRSRASHPEYNHLMASNSYALTGPGTPSSSVRDSYRENSHSDYYSCAPQIDSANVRIPYSSSRHYPASHPSNAEFSSSVYPDSPSQYAFDTPVSPQTDLHSTYPSERYPSNGHELSAVIPSLSRRRDSHALGISVPQSHSSHKSSNSAPSITSSSESWSPAVKGIPDPPKKKTRREKPKIALAPDQPPTTQGKPRARVYVACLQCRTRKIRCDGAKPVCHNCGRRSGGGECNYDSVPRRRGPDKTPGARQRMARELRVEQDGDTSTRRRRRRRESYSESPQEVTQAQQYAHATRSERDDSVNFIPLPGSLSPASSSEYNISPSYMPQSGLPPVEGAHLYGCPCHGLAQCPHNSPYSVSPKSLASVDQLPSTYANFEQLSNVLPLGGPVTHGHISTLDESGEESDEVADISNEPSLNFSRKIWYESLCSLYASVDSKYAKPLSHSDREAISQSISADLRFLFRASNYWFSFFHVPSFFGTFFDSVKRERMQPSLILAALTLSTFWQSSEIGHGRTGRIRALRFRDEAQSALEASFNAGWIDETLAQAAWLLALFEVCAHPHHSTNRSVSAIQMLDNIIRSLALTIVDADDPDTTVFSPGEVPKLAATSSNRWSPTASTFSTEHHYHAPLPSPGGSGCNCNALTLGENWPSSLDHTPMWSTTPAWNSDWSDAEIRKESSRRLCWAAISLAAGHVSYAAANQTHAPDLFIADPANFALLFSGESICRSPSLAPTSPKDTVWALYDRSFLLWHICVKVRYDTSISDVDKAQFALQAWLETDTIEAALNRHTCAIEKAYIFQGREYLFNTRMCISFEFQRYIPLVTSDTSGLFHRKKAEEWLRHQMVVAGRFMQGMSMITGNSNNLLARRPFFVFWFMSQVSRSLSLWQCDNSMTIALEVCKAFLPAIDYLSAIWPCAEQRQRYERVRERLDAACYSAGVSRPPPPNYSLSDPSRTKTVL